ncbi:hypothetical protein RJT34_19247 [Clitoria ternatea]|uniref:Fold protein n=1 Tax=Clitoria ternatea TaxID=43366 RepID=A0AAN9IQX2_CLITE
MASDDDVDDAFDHHHPHHHHNLLQHQQHPHNLSRLSVCTSSTFGIDDDDEDVDNLVSMCVSGLSIESFEGDDDDGDADGEFSDGKELQTGLSSDSENERGGCYSLPSTPPRRRNKDQSVKEYASDNEDRKGHEPRRRKRRVRKERWVFEKNKKKEDGYDVVHGFSGESDESGGGGSTGTGVMVITRPKGGKRSLCMDLEEVKACRDLGFELEHERMLEIPSRVSFSNSTLDTSSGSNSPITNWRISSPGDDPREVKARLKVWAQAVALASTSKYGT